MHIPKCGGTSIIEALRPCGSFAEVHHLKIAQRDELCGLFRSFRDKQIVAGHFSFGVHSYLPDIPYEYAAVFRHPVARTMSVHTYIQSCARKGRRHFGIKFLKDDLVEFTRHYWQARNVATRMLAGIHLMDDRPLGPEDVKRAAENLRSIDFIGTTKNLDAFVGKLAHYGVAQVVSRRNETKRNSAASLDRTTFDSLAELNAYDMRLFETIEEMQ
jgi:hypothetical protein